MIKHSDAEHRTRRHLLPKSLELVLITTLPLVLLHLLRAGDPFCVQLGWPLPAIAPALIALMYGFFPALMSASIVLVWLGAYALLTSAGAAALPAPTVIVGLLLAVLVPAEFREREMRRVRRLREELKELGESEQRLRRANYLLSRAGKSSDPATGGSAPSGQSPSSLTSALNDSLRELQAVMQPGQYFVEANRRLLALLAARMSVRAAAVYEVQGGQLTTEAVASIGQEVSNVGLNGKVRSCLVERRAVTVAERSPLAEGVEDDSVLAAIPIEASSGENLGVLLIFDMPFNVFHDQNVRMIWALAGQLGEFSSAMSGSQSQAEGQRESLPQLHSVGAR
jgi:hypothetical protein